MFVRLYHAQENSPIPQTFEAFIDAIGKWDGLYAELDGSFVWVWHEQQHRYQLDGMVYDRAGAIEYVELKGSCSPTAWAKLCNTLLASPIAKSPTAEFLISDTICQLLRVHDLERSRWTKPNDLSLFT
jgi:hypothetical protein